MIENIGNNCRQYVASRSPYDTGNLRNNGITALQSYGVTTVGFTIGGQNAPYGVLINDNATIRGRANKHHKWINKSVTAYANVLAKELGGVIG